jgi:hypothetical protein
MVVSPKEMSTLSSGVTVKSSSTTKSATYKHTRTFDYSLIKLVATVSYKYDPSKGTIKSISNVTSKFTGLTLGQSYSQDTYDAEIIVTPGSTKYNGMKITTYGTATLDIEIVGVFIGVSDDLDCSFKVWNPWI